MKKLNLCGVIVSILSGVTGLFFSWIVRIIMSGIEKKVDWPLIISITLMLTLLTVVINVVKEIYIAKIVKNFNIKYKNLIFEARFDSNRDNNYLSILTNDINVIESDYLRARYDLITWISMFVCTWINLIIYDFFHGIVILGMAILSLIVSLKMRSKARQKKIDVSQMQELYTHKVMDMFLGISVIKQFLALKRIGKEHEFVNNKLEKVKFDNEVFLAKMKAVSTLFSMGMFYVSFLIGVIYVNKGIYSISVMMASIQLINKIVTPLYEGVAILNKYNGAIAIVGKLESALIHEKEQHGLEFEKIKKISLKNLCFIQGQFEIKNINFEFEEGKKYIIVGKNGAGKSTLLNLIAGQLICDDDSLYINDIPYEKIDRNYIKSAIAYMNQEVYVFNDTIKNNIVLYEKCDNYKYNSILRKSGVDEFISDFEEMDNKILEDNGDNISGGQRQRIALARVLMRDADVILLDEAFSALDYETVRKIINDVFSLDCMVLMVLHRFNEKILKKCDEIIVMDSGQIIETGSYEELINKDSHFSKMYNMR